MSDKININLHIAGFNFPLTINREDEEIIREAAKQVNMRINDYRKYGKISEQQLLAMVAYDFSLKMLRWMQRNDTTPIMGKVKEWEDLLEDELKEKQIND